MAESRHVTYYVTAHLHQLHPFCGETVDRGRYDSIVSTVLMGREQSRDLRRHSSSFVYHVTSLWRLSRHVTYDVTAPPLLSQMRRFWGTLLR